MTVNTFGERVSLTAKTDYECPCDGYFRISCNYASGSYVYGHVNGIKNFLMLSGAGVSNSVVSLFVRKGTVIQYEGVNGYGYFHPLE